MPVDIVYLTTWRQDVSAEEIRAKYFKKALVEQGFTVKDYKLKVTRYNKYMLYLLRRPPRDLVSLARKAGLIITTSPPLINTIIGHSVAKKYGIPLVVDIRDIWEEYAKTTWRLFTKLNVIDLITKYYYRALEYASAITVTTDKMKEYYSSKLGKEEKIHVVSNGTDPDVIKCGDGERDKDLVYLGNFNNPNQALEFLLHTLPNSDLSLIVIGGGRYLAGLKRIAEREGVSDRVEFVGEVKYGDLPRYLCRARVGVVGRPFIRNPQYLYTIPVKIYDYLAAGLPVAGYGPKGSAYGEFITSNNIGIYMWDSDTKMFSKKLVELVKRSDGLRGNARALALKYDRKKWAKVFAKIVASVLSK